MKHSQLLLLIAAFIVACNPQENAFAQQPTSGAPAPGSTGTLIQLETGACRGFCPVYKLTFYNNGTMEYVGTRNVDVVGTEKVRLSINEYSQLLKEVRMVNLWQYPSEIQSTVVDAPVHTFTVFEGTNSHAVKGTAGIPKPIMDLEALMQNIAADHGLPVRTGNDPNNPATLKGQVIVRFNMDVNAKQFCNQFTDLKVRTVRHLSEDNTWVIGFNPTEVTEEQFTSLLKDMVGVMAVEPDKQTRAGN